VEENNNGKSWKCRVAFKREASANKLDGFTIECSDDDPTMAFILARDKYYAAIAEVESHRPAQVPISSK
jgi:hypothetical protein